MADQVEVYLERYSDGVCYDEFTTLPGTLKYTGEPDEKFIEIATNERFRIVVKLLRDFFFMDSSQVRVECHVDPGKPISTALSKNKSQSASPSDRSHRETSLGMVQRLINGRYMDCALTFGALKSGSTYPSETDSCRLTFATDDDIDMDDHSIAEEADHQGRIVVKLRRDHFASREEEEGFEGRFCNPPEHVDTGTTHNKVVHKHCFSHALEYLL